MQRSQETSRNSSGKMRNECRRKSSCFCLVRFVDEYLGYRISANVVHLGAGESGKSTILKQMKLIHASGFSKGDRDDYRVIIFANIMNALKMILEAMEQYDLTFVDDNNEVSASEVACILEEACV